MALGDSFQAKGTLKSIMDNFPLEYYRKKAKEKLAKIEQMDKEKQNASSSSQDSLINGN